MKLVRITEAGAAGLSPGQTYLLDTHTAGQYLMLDWADHCTTYEPPAMPDNPRRILVIRSGGLGDLLFMTPGLLALQAKFPRAKIGVAAFEPNLAALSHPDLDAIERVAYPLQPAALERWDAVIPLELTLERDNEHDAVEVFARAMGVHPLADSRPRYEVPDSARVAAWERYPRHERHTRRLGIQLAASAHCRTWPLNYLKALLELLDPSWQVYLFAEPRQWPLETDTPERLIILPHADPALSFAEACAVLATMDMVLAPDSSLCHIAGALGIPTVALYGAFHWSRRTNHFPSVRAIQGHAPCAPCHHHMRLGDHFPTGQPCERKNYCLAMADIKPDRVLTEIDRQWRKHCDQPHEEPAMA